MQRARWFLGLAMLAVVVAFAAAIHAHAGQVGGQSGYQILNPLSSGNLTIFPVVARSEHDTSMFITLDEGVRSGEVVVTESGSVQPMIRRPTPVRPHYDGAQVNTLVLVNNSKKPLLLLAGEIVTGGKQDRVIGKDRIVPAMSDPIDLGVFCVEPGRWVARSENFDSFHGFVAPSVRKQAMAKKDQQEVWNAVRDSQAKAAGAIVAGAVGGPAAAPPPAVAEINRTSSYAGVMQNREVAKRVDAIVEPIQHNYQALIRELRAKNAVGVVVAVNGQILWADIFASTDLLEKYWPKLVRSYAAEAMTEGGASGKVTASEAQRFLDRLDGTHESADTDPGVYRQAEITGADYKVFALTSLLPRTDFTVHLAKMYEAEVASKVVRPYQFVR
jgi:hypothetical protein